MWFYGMTMYPKVRLDGLGRLFKSCFIFLSRRIPLKTSSFAKTFSKILQKHLKTLFLLFWWFLAKAERFLWLNGVTTYPKVRFDDIKRLFKSCFILLSRRNPLKTSSFAKSCYFGDFLGKRSDFCGFMV